MVLHKIGGKGIRLGLDFDEIFSHCSSTHNGSSIPDNVCYIQLALSAVRYEKYISSWTTWRRDLYILIRKFWRKRKKENLVCKLNKPIYNLQQALRCWYKRFDSFIMSFGYNRLNFNPCSYYDRYSDRTVMMTIYYSRPL